MKATKDLNDFIAGTVCETMRPILTDVEQYYNCNSSVARQSELSAMKMCKR